MLFTYRFPGVKKQSISSLLGVFVLLLGLSPRVCSPCSPKSGKTFTLLVIPVIV